MTVKELIEKLESYPKDMTVVTPLWSDLTHLDSPHKVRVVPQYGTEWFEEYHPDQYQAKSLSLETFEVLVLNPAYPGRK